MSNLGIAQDELIVDNFAGGGGASTGMYLALGRDADIAINHDKEALAMHAANHPNTKHLCEDVWNVDIKKEVAGRRVGLAWFSPDCFPAGTMVLTITGYRPIEEIEVGDLVLTHNMRWRAVTQTNQTEKPLMSIRGHGHPGLAVSHEHPFYARRRTTTWDENARPGGKYVNRMESPDWVPASMLDAGWYWATPCAFPKATVPEVPGRGLPVDDKLLWLAGRYVGDGWTRLTDTRAELVITCDKREAAALKSILGQWPRSGDRSVGGELTWHERATGTAYQFTTSHRGLVMWLREHFGHRAESKRIPGWALGMDVPLREALMRGYLSADGWDSKTFQECRTVSKALAFGLKALANSLDKTVTVYLMPNTTTIEGREINARPIYFLRWRNQVASRHEQTTKEPLGDGHVEWCPIRKAEDTAEVAQVFNIAVEEDESYVVEGIIVHNCKHFSKAKGGKPVEKKIRGLAWVALRWAALVHPRVIIIENVEEFKDWGPLVDGMPCKRRKGMTFKSWVTQLTNFGYRVEWRELKACDYGAPTIRKRLFIVARCDDHAIVWPEPTHGPMLEPYHTAAECIDWSIECPSIFLTPEEARKKHVKRPLADATMRRIAKGIQRYVIDAAQPFIVNFTHDGGRTESVAEPFKTVTGAHRGEKGLVVPTLIQTGYGERKGQSPRVPGLHKPLGTVVNGQKHALVSAFLSSYYGEKRDTDVRGATVTEPLRTQPTENRHAVVSAFMSHAQQGGRSRPATKPLHTITASRKDQNTLVAASIMKMRGTNVGQPLDKPLQTVSAGGTHFAEVQAFLIKYFGTDQDPSLFEPMHTVTSKHRFGLVTVSGEDYEIVDIGLRMLTPRELFNAQGFPRSYQIDVGLDPSGKPVNLTKTAQVRMCGNSVSPRPAAALVAAQFFGGNAREAAA